LVCVCLNARCWIDVLEVDQMAELVLDGVVHRIELVPACRA
jgi:hypothetical protein